MQVTTANPLSSSAVTMPSPTRSTHAPPSRSASMGGSGIVAPFIRPTHAGGWVSRRIRSRSSASVDWQKYGSSSFGLSGTLQFAACDANVAPPTTMFARSSGVPNTRCVKNIVWPGAAIALISPSNGEPMVATSRSPSGLLTVASTRRSTCGR